MIPVQWWLAIFVFVMLLINAIKVLREYERGVVFRLGRLVGDRGPGLIILIPGISHVGGLLKTESLKN